MLFISGHLSSFKIFMNYKLRDSPQWTTRYRYQLISFLSRYFLDLCLFFYFLIESHLKNLYNFFEIFLLNTFFFCLYLIMKININLIKNVKWRSKVDIFLFIYLGILTNVFNYNYLNVLYILLNLIYANTKVRMITMKLVNKADMVVKSSGIGYATKPLPVSLAMIEPVHVTILDVTRRNNDLRTHLCINPLNVVFLKIIAIFLRNFLYLLYVNTIALKKVNMVNCVIVYDVLIGVTWRPLRRNVVHILLKVAVIK